MLRDSDSDTLDFFFVFVFVLFYSYFSDKKGAKTEKISRSFFSLHRNMSADLSHTSACESRVKSVF